MTIPLKEDIVKLEYVIGHTFYSENFIYPLKNKASAKKTSVQKVASKDDTKLNIMILLIGSMSIANAQKHLNATYKMLNKDANSVVFEVRSFSSSSLVSNEGNTLKP